MNPNANEIPGLGLPQPSANPVAAAGQSIDGQVPQVGAPAPLSPPPAIASQASVPAPADDPSDSLDEEWVNKAKAIVEKTKSDPFLESKELNKVRADYLKTRYNKHIKVGEE